MTSSSLTTTGATNRNARARQQKQKRRQYLRHRRLVWCTLGVLVAAAAAVSLLVIGAPNDVLRRQQRRLRRLRRSLLTSMSATERLRAYVTSNGFVFEVHDVSLRDWTLNVHRIYANHTSPPPHERPAVFLQHGLLDTSGSWIATGTSKSIAFVLAANGYDVWCGNVRGNMFSRGGGHCDSGDGGECKGQRRWLFTFEDHSMLDMRAQLLMATRVRGSHRVHAYIGHSMGGMMGFYGLAGVDGEWRRACEEMDGTRRFSRVHIQHMIGLSPAVYVPFISTKFYTFFPDHFWSSVPAGVLELGSFVDKADTKQASMWRRVVRRGVRLLGRVEGATAPGLCTRFPAVCKRAFCVIAGCTTASNWDEHIGTLVHFEPGATSWSVLTHFHQNNEFATARIVHSKHRRTTTPLDTNSMPRAFDWDETAPIGTNQRVYRAKHRPLSSSSTSSPSRPPPPHYDLCRLLDPKMDTKYHVFYSDYDPLVRPDGVYMMAAVLRNCSGALASVASRLSLVRVRNFGHVDFTLGSYLPCDGRMTLAERKDVKPNLLRAPPGIRHRMCRHTINSELLNILASKT